MNETEKQSAIEILNRIMELELAGVCGTRIIR